MEEETKPQPRAGSIYDPTVTILTERGYATTTKNTTRKVKP